jgi:hypothetical protein
VVGLGLPLAPVEAGRYLRGAFSVNVGCWSSGVGEMVFKHAHLEYSWIDYVGHEHSLEACVGKLRMCDEYCARSIRT